MGDMRWSLSFALRVARPDRTWSYHPWGTRCAEQRQSLHVVQDHSSGAVRHHGENLEARVAQVVAEAAVAVAGEAVDA